MFSNYKIVIWAGKRGQSFNFTNKHDAKFEFDFLCAGADQGTTIELYRKPWFKPWELIERMAK